MKKLLVASIAAAAFYGAPVLAADLPTKAPPRAYVAAAPLFNWTGCYFGANTGYAWANKNTNVNATLIVSPFTTGTDSWGSQTADGWAYGGQIGCDYQFSNNWIVGIRGMVDGSSMSGSKFINDATTSQITNNIKVGSFATAVGKLGYLLNPTLQFYGLAGVAWVRDKVSWTTPVGGAGEFASGSQSRTGYDVGVGLSWMFARNWDLWIEYDYMGFGTKNLALNSESIAVGVAAFNTDIKQSVSKILVGIDFRFPDLVGKAPVSAKY